MLWLVGPGMPALTDLINHALAAAFGLTTAALITAQGLRRAIRRTARDEAQRTYESSFLRHVHELHPDRCFCADHTAGQPCPAHDQKRQPCTCM